jgi:hypothetical protein
VVPMSKRTPPKRPTSVPAAISRTDLEAAFPWVRYLPPEAVRELLGRIDSYRAAARIYSRKPPAWLADPMIKLMAACCGYTVRTTANGPGRANPARS